MTDSEGQASRPRILLINFTLDDASPVLAHQAALARQLAKRAGAIHVVTELLGEFEPPAGLSITSIPRWPYGVPRRFGSVGLWLPQIRADVARFRPDVCFVHMAHEWCYRLGPFLQAHNVAILLWYTHKQVTEQLIRSTGFADRIVTATPEGFGLPSNKVEAIGHGIDVGRFALPAATQHRRGIISVGRISAVKRLDLLLEAFITLHARRQADNHHLALIGPTLTAADEAYKRQLERMAEDHGVADRVTFTGAVPQRRIPQFYQDAALHVNVTDTGGLDKSILEALACGCPVLTTNRAYFATLADVPAMRIEAPTAASLADRMQELLSASALPSGTELRRLILGRHDLETHVGTIVARLQALHDAKRAHWG